MLKLDEPPRITGSSEDTPVSAAEREHLDYLERMKSYPDIPGNVIDNAYSAWNALRREFGSSTPIPAASVLEEKMDYYWSRGEHHVNAEIIADEPICWVYVNSLTKEAWGDEIEADARLTPRLIEAFACRILGSRE
jgi:hypothetical protein